MWKPSRKEDDMPVPAPEQPTVRPTQAATPPTAPLAEPRRSGEVATIGKSVIVKGELSGSEDLYVDGEVEGSISLMGQSLTVGPNGRVRANIEARNVIVHGRVDGNVRAADRVDLRKSASLTGDMVTARVAIEDGAYFKGSIDILKADATPKFEARTQPVTPAPTSASTQSPVGSTSTQGTLLEPHKF